MNRTDSLLITTSQAETLRRFIRQASEQRGQISRLSDNATDILPAKLTAYDSSSGAYSWTEQYYDANGLRITKPGGRTGTPAYSPAYPFGNNITATVFPIEVTLRRTVSTAIGPVYEFPWSCGCASIPGPLPPIPGCCDVLTTDTLYLTFTGQNAFLGAMTLTFQEQACYHVNPGVDESIQGSYFGTLDGLCGPVWACLGCRYINTGTGYLTEYVLNFGTGTYPGPDSLTAGHSVALFSCSPFLASSFIQYVDSDCIPTFPFGEPVFITETPP